MAMDRYTKQVQHHPQRYAVTFIVTYTKKTAASDYFTLSKTAVKNGNRVDYTITLKREYAGNEAIEVKLTDTITGNKTLSQNGGTLTYFDKSFSVSGLLPASRVLYRIHAHI